MKPRKRDFFTIPDAPNYEINGYFKIRNKKTGKFLKRYTPKGDKLWARFYYNGVRINRPVETLYRQAVAALDNDEYALIPSLDNRFEINWDGVVRNSKSKRKIKQHYKDGCCYYRFWRGKKCTYKSLRDLLNEVFDKNIRRKSPPIPVILRKDGLAYYFLSIKVAAKFLSTKLYYTAGALRNLMTARKKEIYGWQVTYLG